MKIESFFPNAINVGGEILSAEYSITPLKKVFVFFSQGGEDKKICIEPANENYFPAMMAAYQQHEENAAARKAHFVEKCQNDVASIINNIVFDAPKPFTEIKKEEDAPKTEQEKPAKATRGPVPQKNFIGESIIGQGWKILFDGTSSRTRIIFDAAPIEAARAALDAAGFFYSAAMNSWNKKLTFKAYRAAQALAGELSALYPAAA